MNALYHQKIDNTEENINPDVHRFFIKTPCCGYLAHTRCFLIWTFTSANSDNEMARCAYCRAIYHDIKFCFSCPKTKKREGKRCCDSTIHVECVQELRILLDCIEEKVTLRLRKTNVVWLSMVAVIKTKNPVLLLELPYLQKNKNDFSKDIFQQKNCTSDSSVGRARDCRVLYP